MNQDNNAHYESVQKELYMRAFSVLVAISRLSPAFVLFMGSNVVVLFCFVVKLGTILTYIFA
jgi:hypothetical protein